MRVVRTHYSHGTNVQRNNRSLYTVHTSGNCTLRSIGWPLFGFEEHGVSNEVRRWTMAIFGPFGNTRLGRPTQHSGNSGTDYNV